MTTRPRRGGPRARWRVVGRRDHLEWCGKVRDRGRRARTMASGRGSPARTRVLTRTRLGLSGGLRAQRPSRAWRSLKLSPRPDRPRRPGVPPPSVLAERARRRRRHTSGNGSGAMLLGAEEMRSERDAARRGARRGACGARRAARAELERGGRGGSRLWAAARRERDAARRELVAPPKGAGRVQEGAQHLPSDLRGGGDV